MRRHVLFAALCFAAACGAAPPPLGPFPWEALDAEGRDAVVVYRTRTLHGDWPELAAVTGRLIAAELDGLYVSAGSQPVFLPWSAVRAVAVTDPGRPYLQPNVPGPPRRGKPQAAPTPLDLARQTRVVDRATPEDRRRLSRLSRFPAGRPPEWRAFAWPSPGDAETEHPTTLPPEVPHAPSAPGAVDAPPTDLPAPGL